MSVRINKEKLQQVYENKKNDTYIMREALWEKY